MPLIYYESHCFINAYLNKRHHYKNKNLKYVLGSLAFNGWCEYGGKDWKKDDFFKKHTAPISFDAHAWLEDEEGNIYDCIFPHYNYCAYVNTGKPMEIDGRLMELDEQFVLEGVPKSQCEAYGLNYYPADKETQTAIFIKMYPFLRSTEEKLQSGKCEWQNGRLAERFTDYNEMVRSIASGVCQHNKEMEDLEVYLVVSGVNDYCGNHEHLKMFRTYSTEHGDYKTTYFQTYGGGPEGGYFLRQFFGLNGFDPVEEVYSVERSWGSAFTVEKVNGLLDYNESGDGRKTCRIVPF